jgi:hypothetical protein
MNLIFGECNKASLCFLNCIALIDASVLVMAYLISATALSPMTTVIAIVAFGILALVIRPVASLAKRYGHRLIDARQTLIHHLGELLNAFKVVQGCRMEEIAQRMVEHQTRLTRRYTIRTGLLKYLPFSLLEPLILLVVFGMVLLIQAYHSPTLPPRPLSAFSCIEVSKKSPTCSACGSTSVKICPVWRCFLYAVPFAGSSGSASRKNLRRIRTSAILRCGVPVSGDAAIRAESDIVGYPPR